ncbi:lambda exonuclease family protein [Barnesiella intestinihominis]|uniref:lambda exonuclease family protein n=1 Tax=Barnesiella intestinihominis TaxID=487174 RepID=UPI002666C037|nr:lambda exonuclease family protein [Barnesiella intestinihominis]
MEAQRTLEWYRKRLGCFTGSRIGDLMKANRSGNGFGECAMSYIYQVAGERMLNPLLFEDDENFERYLYQTDISTKQMRWGEEQEPNARILYEGTTGRRIVEVGLCKHPDISHFAASPDGYYYDENKREKGVIEIKSVGTATYAKYFHKIKDNDTLLSTEPRYYYQIMSELMCVEADWCDFIVYNPFEKPSMFIIRIYPDDNTFKKIAERIYEADELVNEIINS